MSRSRLRSAIKLLHLPVAVAAAASLALPEGSVAGALSVGWLLLTVLIGLNGLLRILKRGFVPIAQCSIDAAMIYLPLGGLWFAAYRFGMQVMDFSQVIVSLTAIHFHYSAFAVPMFAGFSGLLMQRVTPSYRLAAAGAVIGPLLVAAGITISPMLEAVTVAVYTACLLIYVYYSLVVARQYASFLLALSSIAFLLTMGFALVYGIGRGIGGEIVSIPTMVLIHGIGNAFGYTGLGLLAWTQLRPQQHIRETRFPMSGVRGQRVIGRSFLDRNGLIDHGAGTVLGLVDDFEVFRGGEFDPSLVHPRLQDFYERTINYELVASTRWLRGFAALSGVYKRIVERLEQLNLPLNGEGVAQRMGSAIVPVDSRRDGRDRVRAWVRWDEDNGKAIFIALYSHHRDHNIGYMNIALPLPFGNMAGILKPSNDHGDGLVLTSKPQGQSVGDEGVYFVLQGFPLRLPLNETFHVRPDAEGSLRATHRMWMFGVPFLQIEYVIFSKE